MFHGTSWKLPGHPNPSLSVALSEIQGFRFQRNCRGKQDWRDVCLTGTIAKCQIVGSSCVLSPQHEAHDPYSRQETMGRWRTGRIDREQVLKIRDRFGSNSWYYLGLHISAVKLSNLTCKGVWAPTVLREILLVIVFFWVFLSAWSGLADGNREAHTKEKTVL